METQIKNDIKNKSFKNIYILYGEETYLINHYAEAIANENVDADMKEFNYIKFSNSLPDAEDIDAFASSYPFMSEKKVMVIQNTGIFKSSQMNQAEYFMGLVKSIPEYLIILFCEEQINKTNALYKEIAKLYPPFEFSFKKPDALSPWLVNTFKFHGISIQSKDALYMCEIAGPSMLNLKSEAEKIVSFLGNKDTVSREDIDNLVTRTVESRVFDMLEDLISGQKEKGIKKLSDLKALNEEPIMIISIIFKKFSGFHMAYLLKDRPISEISRLCSMPEWIIKNNLRHAKNLGISKIATVMSKCRELDCAIKNGNQDKWLALELIAGEIVIND